MPDPVVIPAIVATWKLLGTLYEKYESWDVRRRTSAQAKQLTTRAEELMTSINRAILGGASSDDPQLTPLVHEFRLLLRKGVKPKGSDTTEDWIHKSRRPAATKAPAKKAAAKKAPARRAAAKKAPAKKAAAKKAPAKKAAAKKAAARKRA